MAPWCAAEVDPAREARHHHQPAGRQFLGQVGRDPAAGGGGVARADHGHGARLQNGRIAEQCEHRRRVGQRVQERRVAGRAEKQETAAGGRNRLHLALRFGFRRRAEAAAAVARHFLQRRRGGAEALQQLTEGPRPDPVRAGKAQPRHGVGGVCHFRGPSPRTATQAKPCGRSRSEAVSRTSMAASAGIEATEP
jgi:hypothetical protein